MKPRKYILTLFVLFIGVHQGVAGQYLHPKLKEKEKTVRRVFILRPKVEIQQDGMKGSESMIKESDDCGTALQNLVSTALKERGVDVLTEIPILKGAQTGEEVKYALADIQSLYDRIEPTLRKKPKDVRKGRFSLGNDVAKLDPQASSDAFVVIRANGVKLTKGKQAFALFVPTRNPWSSILLSITLVDSRNGDVLFFANIRSIGDPVEPDRNLVKRIQKSFTDFALTASQK